MRLRECTQNRFRPMENGLQRGSATTLSPAMKRRCNTGSLKHKWEQCKGMNNMHRGHGQNRETIQARQHVYAIGGQSTGEQRFEDTKAHVALSNV